jgi:hypothetical protein
MIGACPCLQQGPEHSGIILERELGVDTTDGRYAAVDLVRCARCRRLWLHYQFEFEAFLRSGRWAEAPIDEAAALTMTAAAAHGYIKMAPWRIIGGSFYGHPGKRVSGGLDFGAPF